MEPPHGKTNNLHLGENKVADQLTAKLISVFVFAISSTGSMDIKGSVQDEKKVIKRQGRERYK